MCLRYACRRFCRHSTKKFQKASVIPQQLWSGQKPAWSENVTLQTSRTSTRSDAFEHSNKNWSYILATAFKSLTDELSNTDQRVPVQHSAGKTVDPGVHVSDSWHKPSATELNLYCSHDQCHLLDETRHLRLDLLVNLLVSCQWGGWDYCQWMEITSHRIRTSFKLCSPYPMVIAEPHKHPCTSPCFSSDYCISALRRIS